MGRLAAIGAAPSVSGFRLVGAMVLEAEDPAAVRAAWASLPGDVSVVVLTPGAAGALSDVPGPPPAPLRVVLPVVSDPDVALGPVRDALLTAARADAERTVAAARAEAARLREQAAEEERAIRRDARDRGTAQGRRDAEATARRGRRQARHAVLTTRQEACDRLRSQVLARLEAGREDPTYPVLLQQLGDRARAALGADARVVEAPTGGVVAEVEGRRVDLSLPRLVEEALAALGGDLEGLWEP